MEPTPHTLEDVRTLLHMISSQAIVHPTAIVGSPGEWRGRESWHPAVIMPGAKLMAFVTVDAGCERPTRIGARTLLMKHVHVGHDAEIGADCELAPGTVIGGLAELGDRVKCGVNVSVLPARKIGEGATIGAGAVVTRDVPAGETWVGNPARKLERPA